MNPAARVTPLTRVLVSVEPESSAADPDPTGFEVVFIYGIGPAGMSAFESFLAGRGEGERINFQVARPAAEEFFGQLASRFAACFRRNSEVVFRTRVVRIEAAEARDVVKALAETAACGHGAGRDDGCGCR